MQGGGGLVASLCFVHFMESIFLTFSNLEGSLRPCSPKNSKTGLEGPPVQQSGTVKAKMIEAFLS